jgi:hypothetical protein
MSFPLPCFDNRPGKSKHVVIDVNLPQFAWSELSEKEVIGSGSFGSVFTANYKGKTIVVKKLLEQHERNLRLFYKEANILNSLDNRSSNTFNQLPAETRNSVTLRSFSSKTKTLLMNEAKLQLKD